MARGTQLQELIYMLRAEVGQSTLVSVGIDNLPALKQILYRNQVMIYDDYDWPFMRITPFKQLMQQEQYYDMPDLFGGMNFQRIESVVVWYSGRPYPIERGITAADYAVYNSFLGEDGGGPVIKWDVKYTDSTGDGIATEQVEVWPIPSDNCQQLQFTGIKNLDPLVAMTDQAEMDDLLIVLKSAHQILSRQKAVDAQKVEDAYNARLAQLKARVKGGSRNYTMGGGPRPNSLRGQTIIRVSGTGTQS